MIIVKLNYDNFEYDIYSLVKAFYPKEDIKFSKDWPEDNISYFLVINYVEDRIELKLYKPDNDRTSFNAGSNSMAEETENNEDNFSLIYEDEIGTDHSDRKETKNRLKRLIYYCFNKKTGIDLPWGTLSGIRPVKIPLRLMENGKSDDSIRSYMKSTYLATDEKIDLSIDIARRELGLIRDINCDNDYSLYIGIPFCPSTCLYCSFTSYVYGMWEDKVSSYLDALRKEMEFISESLRDKNLTTVYIGGGTPTSLREPYLDKLLNMVDLAFPIEKTKEYCIEAGRSDSITRDKLKIMKAHGVNRISVNPQTMNDKTLKLVGRHHTTGDVKESFKMAREEGFSNINMDIIIGLPGEDIDDLSYTLGEISKLNPDSLTVHSLALKRSARLNINKEEYDNLLIENSENHMENAKTTAENLGMKPYYLYRQKNMAGNLENIGYAAEGKEGLYNILIMEEKQTIIALGAGAMCKFVTDNGYTVTRSENVKDPGLYIDRIDDMILRKKEKLEEIGWLKG